MLSSADRWVLAQYSSMHDVGIYSIAAVFGQLFQLGVLMPMQRAYMPIMLEKFAKNKNNLKKVEQWNKKNMILAMIGLAGIISVGYIICRPILYILLPTAYHPAIGYIWLILMGQIFLLGEHFLSLLITFHKKAYFQAVSLFIPSLLNVGLNLLLIPHFKITGCILATLAAYIIYFLTKLIYNLYLQKTYP